jgi:uncharacterized protein YdbL (DUF1318 family)
MKKKLLVLLIAASTMMPNLAFALAIDAWGTAGICGFFC